ncbi:MAG: extracellular solute-binding protein [Oscillospiraceae bacterium]|nr:extracellular solute-binding protein [Oscillospiraceae bacterium]
MKRVISLILIALMVLSVAACETDGRQAFTTLDTTRANEQHAGVQDAVAKIADHPSLPDVEVTKKIKFLSWPGSGGNHIDETSPAAEMFRAKYGVPDQQDEDDRNIIEFWNCGQYQNRYVELAKRISSDDAPDIFPFEARYYPYGIYANLFQSIDGVIDIDSPEWADSREVIRRFEWGGKNYCAVTELVPSYVIWYRRSIMEEAGLDDPYTLYKQGKWDWNVFMEHCERFSDPLNDKYSVSGWDPDESLLCTTGVGLISIEGGKLVSNMYDARIERAMEMVYILSTRNYRYPQHELNNWSMNYNEFRAGNILFWDNGQWYYEELLHNYRDRDGWPDDEICLVPYPRDPYANEYYQQGRQESYMFVAGSKNKEGFQAWTQCVVLTVRDPEVLAQARDKKKVDYGWTDAQLDIFDEILRDLTPVFDFKNGLGEEVGSKDVYENAVEMVTKYVLIHGESYTMMREERRAEIDMQIAKLNASVGH